VFGGFDPKGWRDEKTKKPERAERGRTMGNEKKEPRLSELDFWLRYIDTCRNINPETKEPYAGVHSVYGGGNEGFATYYGVTTKEAVASVTKLVNEGKLAKIPMKGGVMLYRPESAPKGAICGDSKVKAKGTLAKMGL
jgi:hypothetical protein